MLHYLQAVAIKGTITWKRPCHFLPAIVDAPADHKKPVSAAATSHPPSTASTPSISAPAPATEHPQDRTHRIPRDFQRLWSAEELNALEGWKKEEARIEREKQQRNRAYMAFEDAIAYIVNERPRDLLEDADFDADDLVDDGEDDEDGLAMEADVSNGTSPWGVMPPVRIEIAPNSVCKPEIPHGEVVHADMASYLRIVEQLFDASEVYAAEATATATPFLWQAIYPQDNTGQPIYNPGGKYSVRLFVLGRWRRIDIDDKLPLDNDGNIIYLASSMRNELWPTLLVKALYKVLHWMHPNPDGNGESMSLVNNVSQTMSQIVLALTGWKVSRWEPCTSQSFSENVFHELLQSPPPPEFVVIKMPPVLSEQPAGDNSSDTVPSDQASVNIVATLTPVQTHRKSGQEPDSLRKSSKLMAKHLGADPNGSVILLEEMKRQRSIGEETSRRLPLPSTLTLDTISSGHICIPPAEGENLVYRVYPQNSLRFGYSLQIEADYKVEFQDPSTYWRRLDNLRVTECDGVYPVMLPGTWNILFKQSLEFVRPAAASESSDDPPQQLIELRLDLHLSEELLSRYAHITLVNDVTSEVKRVSALCSTITLTASEGGGEQVPTTYTMIVDCAPGNFHVREGKWHLTLASNWDLNKTTTHQMTLTSFGGSYEPNNPMLFFRDVIAAPKTSVWTSFQLQLLKNEEIEKDLAAKLEIFDLGAEQHPLLCETSAKGDVRLLQLPHSATGNHDQPLADDKRGYIVQGSIGKSICVVSEDLRSVRPFRNSSGNDLSRNGGILEEDIAPLTGENASIDSDQQIAEVPPKTARTSRLASNIQWRLNCWSTEKVKLEPDRTKELQFDAIRVSWAENAKDCDTNGGISRLLHQGKLHEAEAKMKLENMTEEQMAKVKSRFEWIQAVKAKVEAKSTTAAGLDGPYLEEISSGDERLLSTEELEESERILADRIGAVEADKEQRHQIRTLAKQQRAKETTDLIQSVIKQRATFAKKQQALRQELTALQSDLGAQSA
ncbi:hypothetical protein BBJ28_00005731 [Nothophytophthora sp. Chile5]|nr:hypothetical protein BBJ28_00005731 [Nothophytophthora sp. Chile5]